MPSAWGSSWGTSWGDSWGATAAVTAPAVGGGGRKRHNVGFTRFTDDEWEKTRKAFAKARKKRHELEEAKLSDNPVAAAKTTKQLALAEKREAEAHQRIIAWGAAEMAAFERTLTERRQLEKWQAFQADLALFYERQRLLIAEEEIIVMLLVS